MFWGGLPVSDNNKCWAETGSNPVEFTQPCGKPAMSEVGLCPLHYEEITGFVWEPER